MLLLTPDISGSAGAPRAARGQSSALWRLGLVLVAAVGSLLLSPVPAAAQQEQPLAASSFEPRVPEGYFGISAPSLSVMARDADPRVPAHVDGIRAAGLDFVRSTVDWRQVEPVLGIGGVHVYDWRATDRLVRALAQRDLELMPELVGTPRWARALDALSCDGLAAVSELHAPSYGDLAGALVARYGKNGAFWRANPDLSAKPIRQVEIWNEPNWTGFWCPRPQPERFAAIAVEAARAIKAADSRVETVLGGMVMLKEHSYFPGGGMRGMEAGTFLARMVAEKPALANLLDHVAVHPYDLDPDYSISLLGWFRGRLADAGLGHAGLFVTEFGWPTTGSPEALGEQARAKAFRALVSQLARTDCGVLAVAPHDWSTPELDPGDPEHWYGIADPQTAALRPAGQAYRDMVGLFEGRGPTPAPRETIGVCGRALPDQDGDGVPDEDDDYPLDPTRHTGSGEQPPRSPSREQPLRPPSTDERFFSVNAGFMPSSRHQRLRHYDAMAAAGVGNVRNVVEWSGIEPADGTSAHARFAWSDLDRRMVAYGRRGIATSVAPVSAPAWLSRDPALADGRLGEVLAAFAGRYGAGGGFWRENRNLDPTLAPRDYEIWTEVNLNSSSWDGSASAGEYAGTYATSRAALRQVDPGARAIVSLTDGGDGSGAASFLRGMVTARPGLAGKIDGVYVLAFGARDRATLEKLVVNVRTALEQSGNPGARLRIGFGAPTSGAGALSEQDRAAFVADAASRLPRLDCGVDEAVLSSWTSAQSNPANAWDWFGVAGLADAGITPTMVAFADAARRFGGFGAAEPERKALHPCVREPLDRDGDGTPDAADPAPLDPTRSTPLATPPAAPGFTAAPDRWTKSRSASFSYSSSRAVSYQCRIDNAAWQVCAASRSFGELADGAHAFRVRAVDDLGLVSATGAHEWTVDTRPPETSIASGPSGLTRGDRVRFSLVSDEPGSSFRCKLDSAPWQACDPSVTYADLAEGNHTFQAAAVDRAGNVDSAPPARSFEVRTVPARPNVEGDGLQSERPTFSFEAAHAVSFECRFDSNEFEPCSGGNRHSPAKPLAAGGHRFEVRGVGPTGKHGQIAGWSFTTPELQQPGPAPAPPTEEEDTSAAGGERAAPTLVLSRARPAKGGRARVRFRARADGGRALTSCRTAGRRWRKCSSPYLTPPLKRGRRAVVVRASDGAGQQVVRRTKLRLRR